MWNDDHSSIPCYDVFILCTKIFFKTSALIWVDEFYTMSVSTMSVVALLVILSLSFFFLFLFPKEHFEKVVYHL